MRGRQYQCFQKVNIRPITYPVGDEKVYEEAGDVGLAFDGLRTAPTVGTPPTCFSNKHPPLPVTPTEAVLNERYKIRNTILGCPTSL